MHPLRFPNNGIRAKIFVRKISFKLRVMRLNHVELFYAFLLHFLSEDSEEEGWPATASPHAGPATHGQAGCKWQSPAGAGGGCPPQGRKGQPRGQGCRLQGRSLAGAVASRGNVRTRWLRPPEGSSACRRGGSADGGKRASASFREKDDHAPINSENSEDYPCVHNS
ncbi:hypothetical protein GW17_00005582 [Ensete ventricosum]|nr:hypothetical protein GW17_00005582 [Ensete ventricosum]RZS14109.1 hypothetical protein BHM03_00045769 [Ensete ventricosum]